MNKDKLIRLGDVREIIEDGGMQERQLQAIAALPALPAVRVKPLVWLLRETGWNAYCTLSERTYTAFSEGQKREIEAARAARILATLDLTPAPAPECLHPFCGDKCGQEATAPDVARLVEAVKRLLDYVPIDIVRCRGDKCREPWCASCFLEDQAEEGLQRAKDDAAFARATLGEVYEESSELISYRHKDDRDNKTRFIQYRKDAVPKWAADIQPHKEADMFTEDQK